MTSALTTLLRTFTVRRLQRRASLRGAASAFDLRGTTYRQYRLGRDAARVDAEAIRADFEAVGDDLRSAMDRYSATQ